MNYKNVEYTDCKTYIDDLVKSLSNFCNKSPLKPMLKVVRDMALIYVYYNDKELEIKINVNNDKKKVIGNLKKKLEKEYPVIYEKLTTMPSADDVRKRLNEGLSLEEALNSTTTYKPLYRIERIHDKYNEIDCLCLENGELCKFKCRIPVVMILENLKLYGKESDVLNNINMIYKISSYKEKVANGV